MALTRRVEFLLDPQGYERLEEVARRRGESVAATIRRAVERECLGQPLEKKRQAVERLLEIEASVGSWEDFKQDLSALLTRTL